MQRQPPFHRQPAVRVRAADEILYEQRIVIERRREEEARAIALPTRLQSLRTTHGAQVFEHFCPDSLRFDAFEISARRLNQPCVVREIELTAQAVEPLEKYCAPSRAHFDH